MADTAPITKASPGPLWMWFTAWSLQGGGMVGVEALGFEGAAVRFGLSGLVAALPLLALYGVLRRRSCRDALESVEDHSRPG